MRTELEKSVLQLLAQKVGGLTLGALIRELREVFPDLERKALQDLLKELMAEGRLAYRLRLGSTRITLGGYQPVRVSRRIYLMSSPFIGQPPPEAICIRMMAGSAFGNGDHPTTCMMLRALEHSILLMRASKEATELCVLDVGTGNGVLAIAAVLLGAGRAVGLDIDPQACYEARMNAAENGVAQRISIAAGSLHTVGANRFSLVLANLRPPTLAGLLPHLVSFTSDDGLLLLSGFRSDEQPGLEKLLSREMRIVWQENDRDWAAMVIRRATHDLKAAKANSFEGR